MLTEKQKRFCENIVSGMNNDEAYLNAYNSNAKPQTAYNEAYKLLLKEEIRTYINTLNKPLEEAAQIKVLNARTEQINFIKERIELCKQKDDEQSIIRYTDMLNKINALYKESETEQKNETNINNIDTTTLYKLTGA